MSSALDQVARALSASRARPSELRAPSTAGIVAIYLRSPDALPVAPATGDVPLFVGCSDDLAQRELETHFGDGKTGFSTLRRSIGALIKEHLSLTAVPRSAGSSLSNSTNFKFDPEGERRLTLWMAENLDVSVYQVESGQEELKKRLIGHLHPALNLTGWRNPHRAEVERRRKVCADEARGSTRR